MEGGFSRVAQGLGSAFRGLADAVFPEHCLGCGAEGEPLCPACRAALAVDPRKRTLPDGTEVVSFYPYGTPLVRRLITEYKFSERTALKKVFEKLISLAASKAPTLFPSAPVIFAPIPLSRRRRIERGFNQAEVIAEVFLRQAAPGSSILPLLKKIRNTAQQAKLERSARSANVRGAFALRSTLADSRPIVLVDDVITSGETLLAAAAALRQAGEQDVSAMVFAEARED